MIAFDQPGTTRDSIYVEFERGGRPYTLIDTAGLRRKAKVDETAEKFSVVKTLQSIEDANVVVTYAEGPSLVADHGFTTGHIGQTSFEKLLSPSAMKIGVDRGI